MCIGPVHPRRKVRPGFPAQARTEGHALRSGKILHDACCFFWKQARKSSRSERWRHTKAPVSCFQTLAFPSLSPFLCYARRQRIYSFASLGLVTVVVVVEVCFFFCVSWSVFRYHHAPSPRQFSQQQLNAHDHPPPIIPCSAPIRTCHGSFDYRVM